MNTTTEHQAKDAGIETSASSNLSAMDRASDTALDNLRSLPVEVSSDTILPNLHDFGFTDDRVMGPVMLRLIKVGAIVPTYRYRQSTRLGSHRTPRSVYRNLYAQG